MLSRVRLVRICFLTALFMEIIALWRIRSMEPGRSFSRAPARHSVTGNLLPSAAREGAQATAGAPAIGGDSMEFLTGPKAEHAEHLTKVRTSAQFARLHALQTRQKLLIEYSPFASISNLDSPTREKFYSVLLDLALLPEDLNRLSQDLGAHATSADRSEFFGLAKAAETAKLNAQLRSCLGDTLYPAFLQYQGALEAENYITALEQSLPNASASPFDSELREKLVTILMANKGSNFIPSLIAIPNDQSAPVIRDGYHFVMVKNGSSYVAYDGQVYSSLIPNLAALAELAKATPAPVVNRMVQFMDQQNAMQALGAQFAKQ